MASLHAKKCNNTPKDMEEVLQSMRRNLYGELCNNYAISTFYNEKGKCIPYLIHILYSNCSKYKQYFL